MRCFSCCGDDDFQRGGDNGAFMTSNTAGHNAAYPMREDKPKDTQTVNFQPPPVSAITVDELKEVTDNFGTKALIGGGSYGRVYYGVLKNGQAAALKKLDSCKQPEQEFLGQVSMVSRLKHENVLELVGYCLDSTLRVLAYEYSPNGSLHVILHVFLLQTWSQSGWVKVKN